MKRIISFLLCFILIFNITALAFPDSKGHWAEPYALRLKELGIFNGDDYGKANLADNIRRSEFIALLVRSLYGNETIPKGEQAFDDVKSDQWYYDIISFAVKKGITSGAGDGNFYPTKAITREEIVLMLYRALELPDGTSSFSDVPENYMYYKEISALVSAKIINGFDGNIFKPTFNATRGDCTAMLCRVLDFMKEEPEQPEANEPEVETPDEPEIVEPEITEPEITVPSGKINLTWHQIYSKGITSTGSYHMDGLNVISPLWFRIIKIESDIPKAYEYPLGGVPNYYFQDYGSIEYMNDAKKNGYEVWPLFKGDGTLNGQSKFLNNDEARANAIEQLRAQARYYGFSGINMDFENMKIEDKDKYTQFVKEMAQMCKEEGLVLSVDVTKYLVAGGTWSMCYDRTEIAKYADYVALMAYDEYGVGSKTAGSVGSLPWVEESINITLKEVPAYKLLLGIPFYTRLWREVNGAVVKTSAIGMETAMEQIEKAGAEIVYDEKTGQNYAEWIDDEGRTCKIWLEDETSIKARIDLMHKYNLAGIASWSKTFETQSVWKFIEERL